MFHCMLWMQPPCNWIGTHPSHGLGMRYYATQWWWRTEAVALLQNLWCCLPLISHIHWLLVLLSNTVLNWDLMSQHLMLLETVLLQLSLEDFLKVMGSISCDNVDAFLLLNKYLSLGLGYKLPSNASRHNLTKSLLVYYITILCITSCVFNLRLLYNCR